MSSAQTIPPAHTSLRNLGKCQARTPLQIDVVGEDKGAQCSKRLARKEVGFTPLRIPLAPKTICKTAKECPTNILEILKEIGDSLSLAVGENGLIQAFAGFSCGAVRVIVVELQDNGQSGADHIPPQHVELQMPITMLGVERGRRQR